MGIRHVKKLWPSTEAHKQFVDAILERYGLVRNLHLRLKGSLLEPPADLRSDFRRFHTLLARWSSGDDRHSMSEIKACQAIAQWTLDVNCKLRNQPPKTIHWRGGNISHD